MSASKLQIFVLLASLCSIVSSHNDAPSYQVVEVPTTSHNMIICQEQPGDRLLLRQMVKKKFSVGAFVDATVQYPLDGVPGNATVHCVKALDQRSDDTGGYAKIIDGGLGEKVVTVYMKSQLWRGFEFIVEISGQ